MDKYDTTNDRYCYSGTSVLKNKLNIKNVSQLEHAERDITEKTINNIEYHSPPFNLNYFKYLHKTLFFDLYDWAGNLRNVNISKGGTLFCIYERIEPESEKIFKKLNTDKWLKNLSKINLSKKLAEYYCDFNMIHPFREGNGRVQRIFFEHLVLSVDYELDWSHVTKDEWIQANIEGVVCHYSKMEAIFNRILINS